MPVPRSLTPARSFGLLTTPFTVHEPRKYDFAAAKLITRNTVTLCIGLLRPALMFGGIRFWTAPTWKRCCREAVQFAEHARVLTECEARTGGANRRPLGRRVVVAGMLQLYHLCSDQSLNS